VHVLAVLAYKDGEHVTSRLLALSVNTNPVIIRRLLLVLQRARLIETRKGTGVGSRLSRSAEGITLAEVFKAVEEDEPFVMPRRKPNRACPIGNSIQSAISDVFVSARNALERDLARTSVSDILSSVNASGARVEAARQK
jgi:DNA-binding IscR family transcriptional regulator